MFVRQISQFGHREVDESLVQRRIARRWNSDDKRSSATSAASLDDALLAEGLEGIAHRRCCYPEHRGELVFHRELFSLSQESERNRGGESLNNRLRAQDIGQGTEDLRLHPR